jgi:hypothetical protein
LCCSVATLALFDFRPKTDRSPPLFCLGLSALCRGGGVPAKFAGPDGTRAANEQATLAGRRLRTIRRVTRRLSKVSVANSEATGLWCSGRGGRRGRNLSGCIMFPERMRARRTSSSGEAGRTANVATLGPIAAIPNAGTRIATRHVNPTPPATFALNSAKASTVLLCCCGARVCKGCSNREKADDQQITHRVCPPFDSRTLFGQCKRVKGLK